VITIDEVGKTFGRVNVLDGVSLSVQEGERLALIGSNGAGKTTLIRCLLGEYAYSGEILVDGRSPRRERRAVLDGIGFVPQLPPPLKMPVSELVRFAAAVSRTGEASVAAILDRLGLELADVAAKPFVKLSGGQKQKILAAIALGRDCKLLILDEPTANLDPAARKVLFDLLAERPERPMIISSHRIEEVAGLVNRVVEMDRGRIVLDERIEGTAGVAARQACTLTIRRAEPAFANAMREWGFRTSGSGLEWRGEVASADRMRFLALVARYGGLVAAIELAGGALPLESVTRKSREEEQRHALGHAR
jgi:ABC-2 type transport system ATP-binding protein